MGGCGCGPHQVSKILCNICSSGPWDRSWGMWTGVGTYVNMQVQMKLKNCEPSLTDYQQGVNTAAENICLKNPSMICKHAELLESAQHTIGAMCTEREDLVPVTTP